VSDDASNFPLNFLNDIPSRVDKRPALPHAYKRAEILSTLPKLHSRNSYYLRLPRNLQLDGAPIVRYCVAQPISAALFSDVPVSRWFHVSRLFYRDPPNPLLPQPNKTNSVYNAVCFGTQMEMRMKKIIATLAMTLIIAAITIFRNADVAAAHPAMTARESAPTISAQPNPIAGLIPFVSKEGGFSVKMPGEPKASAEDIDTAVGKVALHMFTVETNSGNDAYMIEYSDFSIVPDAASAIDAAINGQVGSFKGKITADKKVTLNGWPGRTVTIEGPEATSLSSAYMAGNRLYQVMFVMVKGETLPPDVSEYFASFLITKSASAK